MVHIRRKGIPKGSLVLKQVQPEMIHKQQLPMQNTLCRRERKLGAAGFKLPKKTLKLQTLKKEREWSLIGSQTDESKMNESLVWIQTAAGHNSRGTEEGDVRYEFPEYMSLKMVLHNMHI